jgi:hypothetical protein
MRKIIALTATLAAIASSAAAFPGGHSTPLSPPVTTTTTRDVGPVVITKSTTIQKNVLGQTQSVDTTRTVMNTNNGHSTTTTQDCTGTHLGC